MDDAVDQRRARTREALIASQVCGADSVPAGAASDNELLILHNSILSPRSEFACPVVGCAEPSVRLAWVLAGYYQMNFFASSSVLVFEVVGGNGRKSS